MSGMAACLHHGRKRDEVEERFASLSTSFSGRNLQVKTYADEDIAVVVSDQLQDNGPAPQGSFSEIFDHERYLLASEGYLTNVEGLAAAAGIAQGASRAGALLGLFEREEERLLARLSGSCYLLIWDKQEKKGWAAGCNYGIRTLFYLRRGGSCYLSSEIKVLNRLLGAPLPFHGRNLARAFAFGDLYDESTVFQGLEKLLPGSCLISSRSRDRKVRANRIERFRANVRQNREILQESRDGFRRLMQGNVEKSLALGGGIAISAGAGIDSTLLAVLAEEAAGQVRMITQGFPGARDEADGAGQIARGLGADHQIVRYRPSQVDLVGNLTRYVRAVEEPAWWSSLGAPIVDLLDQIGHGQPLDGVIFGVGADTWYQFRETSKRRLRTGLATFYSTYAGSRSYYEGKFNLLSTGLWSKHWSLASQLALYSYLLQSYENVLRLLWQNLRMISCLARGRGVETIFPYLMEGADRWIMSMPDALRKQKYASRKLVAERLGRECAVFAKRGFAADTVHWHRLAGTLQPGLDLLLDSQTLNRDIYDRKTLSTFLENYRKGSEIPTADDRLVGQLMIFEIFCRQFGVAEEGGRQTPSCPGQWSRKAARKPSNRTHDRADSVVTEG